MPVLLSLGTSGPDEFQEHRLIISQHTYEQSDCTGLDLLDVSETLKLSSLWIEDGPSLTSGLLPNGEAHCEA